MNTKLKIRIDAKGRVVIPAGLRRALGIKPRDVLAVRVEDGELRIMTLRRRIELAQRRVRKYVEPGVSLADELIADGRLEVLRERE